MKKDFEEWNKHKKDLQENKLRVFFHEREVWFASLGVNVGFEQDGKGNEFLRPVAIIKKFNNEVLWCIPLTKRQKVDKHYFSFTLCQGTSVAILSQIRLIDSKRLQYKFGDMTNDDFIQIKEKLKQLLA